MKETFQALIVDQIDGVIKGRLCELNTADLPDEDVLVKVDYSTINFKDGLAVSEHSPMRVAQSMPMIAGIDLAGTVIESASPNWQPNDRVLVNGFGLSERHWGGLSQYARLNADWLVAVPEAISNQQAMAIGTAGFTAMMCVLAIEDHGVKPSAGPVLVTGASGGVGSIATLLLASLGYEVVTASGNIAGNRDYLLELGASRIIGRDELARDSKPLESEQWAAVVDCVGGQTLATAIAQTAYSGIVTMTGLTGGVELNTTVMPFALRNLTLRGVDSVQAPLAIRQRAWQRFGELMPLGQLQKIYRIASLAEVPALCDQLLRGVLQGRIVVDVNAK